MVFIYRTSDFDGVRIEKVKKKAVAEEWGPADGAGESPEHYCFDLKDNRPLPVLEKGPRYSFPTSSFISIIGGFQYLNFRSGSGILFLTQYSDELKPNPASNEELTLDFQGLTKDGRYYVAAPGGDRQSVVTQRHRFHGPHRERYEWELSEKRR